MTKKLEIAETYKKLREIDVHKLGLVEKKKTNFGKDLDYISWANALDLLKQHDANATFTYDLDKEKFYPDGTMMVQVTLHTLGTSQSEIMPVIAGGNKAITNPNSHQINTSYKRCLAKCISTTTGLGISLYAGDLGINDEEKIEVSKENKPKKEPKKFEMIVPPSTKLKFDNDDDFVAAYKKTIKDIDDSEKMKPENKFKYVLSFREQNLPVILSLTSDRQVACKYALEDMANKYR